MEDTNFFDELFQDPSFWISLISIVVALFVSWASGMVDKVHGTVAFVAYVPCAFFLMLILAQMFLAGLPNGEAGFALKIGFAVFGAVMVYAFAWKFLHYRRYGPRT